MTGLQCAFYRSVLAPGFEPGSKESFMMGHYTTQAGILPGIHPYCLFDAAKVKENTGSEQDDVHRSSLHFQRPCLSSPHSDE